MTSSDPQDIITLCVDRYAERRWTLRDCLDRYPEYADEITEMLSLCDDLFEHAPKPMTRQELAVGEQEIITELDRYVASRQGRFSLASLLAGLGTAAVKSRIAVAASALMVLTLAGGSVSLAATFSGPESVLYDYKLALEEVQVKLAAEADKPRLYMQMAEHRLDELENLAEDAAPEVSRKIARNYDTFVSSGLATLQDLSSAETGAAGQEFNDSRRDYMGKLEDHRDRLETFVREKPAYTEEAQELIVLTDASLEHVPTEPPVPPVALTVVTATPAPDQLAIAPDTEATADGAEGGTVHPDGPTATVSTDAAGEDDPAPAPTPTAAPSPTPDLLALPQTEINGTVTALGTTMLIVDGRRVIVNTRLAPELVVIGAPVVGSTVTVTGVERDDGVVVATGILVESVGPTPTPTPTQSPTNTPTPAETPTPTETPTQAVTPTPAEAPDPNGAVFATGGVVIELSPDEMVVGDLTISLKVDEDGNPVVITGGELVVGATVRVEGQVLVGNLLVATTVVVEAPPAEGDEPDETDLDGGGAEGDVTPTTTDELDETPTPDPTSTADASSTPTETDEETPSPTLDPDDDSSTTPTPTTTVTPDGDSTPTPTPTPTPTAEGEFPTVTGEVEEIGEDFIQVDGQILQIVPGEEGTVMIVTPEVGAVVTVLSEVQADGTLLAISIVEGTEPGPTPTPTPEPEPTDPAEATGTSEESGDEASG